MVNVAVILIGTSCAITNTNKNKNTNEASTARAEHFEESRLDILDDKKFGQTATLIQALSESGANTQCFSFIIDASEDKVDGIAKIRSLGALIENEFDAVLLSSGRALIAELKSLKSMRQFGKSYEALGDVINSFLFSSKPIGFVGSSVIFSILLQASTGASVTLSHGQDSWIAEELKKTGAYLVNCAPDDFVSDRDHKILSTPGYLCEATQVHVNKVPNGIRRLVNELIVMA